MPAALSLIALLPTAIPAQAPSLSLRVDYTKTEAMIPMRDGVKLYTAIYAPKDATKTWPVLLTRTPYGAGPYGANRFPTGLGPTPEFSRRGYVFVVQDVRGRYMSEGTHIFSPPHNPKKRGTDHDESSDTYDTVEWLLKNVPNHNGKVGVWGISQPGFYATNALLSRHPAIVAVSPQAPVTDRFKGDDDHHNGAFFLAQRWNFLNGFGAPRPIPVPRWDPTFRQPISDAYRFFLDLGPLPNAQRYFKNRNQFWNQVMAHDTYDGFWKPRGMEQHLKDLSGPAVLVVGGWFDQENLFGALRTYRAIATQSPRIKSHLVMGPWTHGTWGGGAGESLGAIDFGSRTGDWYRENIVLPFFEHHLRGGPDPKLPAATVFESGTNQWHRFMLWPPRIAPTTYALLPKGNLSATAGGPGGSETYTSDPRRPVPYTGEISGSVRSTFMVENQRFAWNRSDVMSYETGPFANDVTLRGPITADLKVSISTTDADFVVKVIDVYPDDAQNSVRTTPPTPMAGYQMLVRAEVMRGKFRESLERPKPFVPGKPTRVTFGLNDVSHTIKKGHRLMIQVQSSWFPLTDLNPQTFTDIYRAKASDFRPATIRLHYGRDGSRIHLPIVSMPDELP
ncbi:MAG: CocE/NonD family hydrolase [Fimbriimonas sp.]